MNNIPPPVFTILLMVSGVLVTPAVASTERGAPPMAMCKYGQLPASPFRARWGDRTTSRTSIDLAATAAHETLDWVATIRVRAGSALFEFEQDLGMSNAIGESLTFDVDLSLPEDFQLLMADGYLLAANVRLRGHGADGHVHQQSSLPLAYIGQYEGAVRVFTQEETEALGLDRRQPVLDTRVRRAPNEIMRVGALPPKVSTFDADADSPMTDDSATMEVR